MTMFVSRLVRLLESDSTRRALRSFFQALLWLATAFPVVLALLPAGSPLAVKGASLAAGFAVVVKVHNKLEELGLLPSWFKDAPVSVAVSDEDEALDGCP